MRRVLLRSRSCRSTPVHPRCCTRSFSITASLPTPPTKPWDEVAFHRNSIKDSTWTSPGDAQGISDALRLTMRTLTHPVVLVTACCESSSTTKPPPVEPDQDDVELLSPYYQDFCGAAISSLQTVTLGPPAMISFNLKLPSRTLSGLLHHKQFGVHLLSGKLAGTHVADAFIKKSHHESFRELTQRGYWVGLGLGPQQSRENNPEVSVPLIRGPGIFAFMRCEVMLDKCIEVGDHVVVIAKVASVGVPRNRFAGSLVGLAYQHGEYGGRLSAVQGAKYAKNIKVPGALWQIKRNDLRIHNDVLGYATAKTNSSILEVGADPLGSLGEEEDGELMSLSEEGYQNLAKLIDQNRQQEETGDGSSSENQETGSEKTELGERSPVESLSERNTGIAPEQEKVLKISPS